MPGGVDTPYYLHPAMVEAQPCAAPRTLRLSTTFRYDPDNPVPTIGGNLSSLADAAHPRRRRNRAIPWSCAGTAWSRSAGRTSAILDGRRWRRAHDVLVFQSAPLDEPLRSSARWRRRCYVSSAAPDTDFTVKLIDVFPPSADYPHGYASTSPTRSSGPATTTIRRPELMEPGEVYELTIPMYGTGDVFGRGHRVRVDISSSNFPRSTPTRTPASPSVATITTQPADNTVHHDAKHQSRIVLPVVPLEEDE